ncbi:MAG TPA: gamma-glutamyl-gamma-aminobutyrate hydrolase family protein [Burkholderiaceae bacterium]|nr:gamma-glutamyl-gamma-aminobutyrate hydrolase family protein [Burkholderiaceae bacterium]
MKVVAVSQRIDQFPERYETRDALDHRLISLLQTIGYLPVPVPNSLVKTIPGGGCDHQVLSAWVAAVKPKAFVLSGGNSIGQCLDRDLTEGYLLDYAELHRLPLLGICRGMQMIAHWAGAGLEPVQGHVRTQHELVGEITGGANSYHEFSLTDCPGGFKVLARSEDGEIEAIGHRSLPWEGWMWHPEREKILVARDVQRIQALFSDLAVRTEH